MHCYSRKQVLRKRRDGKIFLALDESCEERKVVIKRYDLTGGGIPQHCLREIVILRQLQHENIVSLQDVIFGRRHIDLILSYGGINLRSFCRQYPPEVRIALVSPLIGQMLTALSWVHAHGYMHRDIKPENILISDYTFRLCDFGLARPAGKFVSRQYATAVYRPPEMYHGKACANSDVWSLACVFYEFIVGRLLFRGKSDYTIASNIVTKIPCDLTQLSALRLDNIKSPCAKRHDLPGLPDEYLPLLTKMLVFLPEKRTSSTELCRQLGLPAPVSAPSKLGPPTEESDFVLSFLQKKYNLPEECLILARRMGAGQSRAYQLCCLNLANKLMGNKLIPANDPLITSQVLELERVVLCNFSLKVE